MEIKSITLLGDKDNGKSTTIGSLMMLTNSVTDERVEEAKNISRQLGRKFEPGFILDSFSEEREGGLTIDITRAQILYKNRAFEFIDVPGHEEFIKNMISGASYASSALLIVSAKRGEGVKEQTKRHVFISRMLGIKNLVVAVNKMDSVGYRYAAFRDIEGELLEFFERIGFDKKHVHFVPISAYTGENLISKSKNMKWYSGKTVIELLQDSNNANRRSDKKLRLLVQGAINDNDKEHVIGKILSGKLGRGDTIKILPSGKVARVNVIIVRGKSLSNAKAGDNAMIMLDKNMDSKITGSVMCHLNDSIEPENTISGLVFAAKPITKIVKIRINGAEIKCNKVMIDSAVETSTGLLFKEKKLKALNAANVRIELDKKIVVDTFDNIKEMGRFVIQDSKGFAGFGIVTRL